MYFENKIQNLRLTIDDNLFFYSPITGIKFKEKFIIVEIKYQKNIEFINSLDKLRFTRYSKYIGLLKLLFLGLITSQIYCQKIKKL